MQHLYDTHHSYFPHFSSPSTLPERMNSLIQMHSPKQLQTLVRGNSTTLRNCMLVRMFAVGTQRKGIAKIPISKLQDFPRV
jgi:hypothetical protein